MVGHDRLLQEALVNYVTNAIKYTPSGGRIAMRVFSKPPMVRVEVSDNGIGIAPEDQARLFQEFFRVPGGGGTGRTGSRGAASGSPSSGASSSPTGPHGRRERAGKGEHLLPWELPPSSNEAGPVGSYRPSFVFSTLSRGGAVDPASGRCRRGPTRRSRPRCSSPRRRSSA
ncbi:MAG: ATP-binding protein [Holophagales bacterium]|nr:ATP-binding protein [Holophagales bacterium]